MHLPAFFLRSSAATPRYYRLRAPIGIRFSHSAGDVAFRPPRHRFPPRRKTLYPDARSHPCAPSAVRLARLNATVRRVLGGRGAQCGDARVVHFIPRSEAAPEQLGLVDEVIRNKPDAIVLAPFDPEAMVPAVDKLDAAGIPVTNVNERLAGGRTV